MIKSSQIKSLLEEWLKSFSLSRGLIDVYKNPSKSDYSEIYQSFIDDVRLPSKIVMIRFIADAKTKSVYVWNGQKAIHAEVARSVGLIDRMESDPTILSGIGVLVSGKAEMQQADSLESIDKYSSQFDINYYNGVVSRDWSWVNRYIQVTKYLGKLKPL